MVDKLKRLTKENFYGSPKAKIIIAAIAMIIVITTVIVMNVKKTITICVNDKQETFVTYKGTVKEVLQENGIEVNPKDKLQPSLESKISDKESIEIKKAIPINISANGIQLNVQSAEDNIGDMLIAEQSQLKEKGIEFDKDVDEVYPSLDSKMQDNLTVNLVKVQAKEVVEKQTIVFDTVIEKDDKLDKSVKNVKTEGANGEKEITYQVVYKDGVESSRKVKSTKVTSEPKNKVVVEGTGTMYASRGEDASSSSSSKGKKQITCSATAYSGGIGTSSGRKPCRNESGISTIAVDPTVIPIGSKVYIDGYGYAVAADTGSGIKGNKIDLYFNTNKECSEWGLRQVQVTIIANPGEW